MEAFVDRAMKNMAADEKPAYPLFHYSSLVGIEGILRSDELWLTDIRDLTDSEELEYGMGLAFDAIAPLQVDANPYLRFFGSELPSGLSGKLDKYFRFFVGSLTPDCSSPHQWEHYGDQGRGGCIGLAEAPFAEREPDDHLDKAMMIPMMYDEERARRVQFEGVQYARSLILDREVQRRLNVRTCSEFLKGMSIQLSIYLIANALRIKRPQFVPEAEIRVLLFGHLGVMIPYERARPGRRYAAWPFRPSIWSPGTLSKVLVGKNAAPSAVTALRTLLLERNLSGVELKQA